MTLQQLEYILALDKYGNFAKAAFYCNVTQPTLSSMIQKLEIPAIISVQLPQKLVRIPLQRCQREMI